MTAREATDMYEHFTDRSRKAMQLANREAQRLCHEYIGTEHVLLGLLQEGHGVAAHVLMNFGLDSEKTRQEVTKLIHPGTELLHTAKLPTTPRAKKVIEFAMEEARNLNHNYVGTEHLLLGLLREEEGVAAQVLINFGLTLGGVREEVINLLGHSTAAPPAEKPVILETDDLPLDLQATVAALNAEIDRLRLQKENAIAEQDFQTADSFRNRADRLRRTRVIMVRYWILNRTIDRAWLSSNGGAVRKLVQEIDAQRLWDKLPNLADALAAVGCNDTEMIDHCRQPGEHTRQCWVVDLLLTHA